MARNRLRNTSRAGFTLIELLVVIAIIAILVGLTAAGVFKILDRIPEVQTRTEISQFDGALGAFMADYNLSDPPPSVLVLREDMAYNTGNAVELRSLQFLKKAFGKNLGPTDWNQNGNIDQNVPFVLEGEQCLVFYLGGVQTSASGTPQCLGFSTNNVSPAMGGGSRKGPYFQFNSARLIQGPASAPGFNMYLDPWKAKVGPKAYAYFSSNGVNNGYSQTDCQSLPAVPYRDAGGNFAFSNKYQIISAGKDGLFFTLPAGPTTGVWSPSGGTTGNDADNQVNFSSRLLGAGQQ